jgi:acetyl/propionyl-CoA carboxylase alpha subunit
MFSKILIANRGAVAVRIIRTCRDLGIKTAATFSETDRDSLHVRLADECIPIVSEFSYGDKHEVLEIARRVGADAIHPGYGFLAEEADFAKMCSQAGIAFIGPPPTTISRLRNKLDAIEKAQSAGFKVPEHSEIAIQANESELLGATANDLGFPLVLKSCKGGRGRGSRVIMNKEQLPRILGIVQRETAMIYGDSNLYLERAIPASHHVAVQVLGDAYGNIVHLGEHEGSLVRHNQKLFEESPAPCLNPEQRQRICQAAVEIARLFNYQNLGTVEFVVDANGEFYFTEIKARLQIEHPVTEMVTGIDLVEQQIRVAAGEPLSFQQSDIQLRGVAMQCRINAEDPWHSYLPSPGRLERFGLPGGMHVRVDTYGYVGCQIPVRYDSLLAKLTVWGETRAICLSRLRRALQDFKIMGVQTNLPLHTHILDNPDVIAGKYDTTFMWRHKVGVPSSDETARRDLAAAAAVAFTMRHDVSHPVTPPRLQSGWHRSSRAIPGG